MEELKDLSLTESDVKKLKAAFNLLDLNSDGCVNVSELHTMLTNIGIAVKEDLIQEIIRSVSKEGNSLLTEAEFMAWMGRFTRTDSKDELMEDLLAAFQVFDKDGNGFITKDELRIAMETIGEKVTEKELQNMLRQADVDNDGMINYQEFLRIML